MHHVDTPNSVFLHPMFDFATCFSDIDRQGSSSFGSYPSVKIKVVLFLCTLFQSPLVFSRYKIMGSLQSAPESSLEEFPSRAIVDGQVLVS
jgi:hypothetical protein